MANTPDTRYYVVHPGGRERLKPNPKSDEEAMDLFDVHWSVGALYANNFVGKSPSVYLIKETRSVLAVCDLEGEG